MNTEALINTSTIEAQSSNPSVHQSIDPHPPSASSTAPLPSPVDGAAILDQLSSLLRRFLILPAHGPESLALWTLHTYAFQLRDVTTYLGIESPEKRCGKTTLLTVLSELVNRPVVASNISSPAFFRVIEEIRPTLLIDEADTVLHTNEQLRGILNSGYTRKTAYVMRVTPKTAVPVLSDLSRQSKAAADSSRQSKAAADGRGIKGEGHHPSSTIHHPSHGEGLSSQLSTPNSQLSPSGTPHSADSPLHYSTTPSLQSPPTPHSSLARFSCWCPKAIAAIGRLPETLGDRCILIRMQRKTPYEECQRLRNLDTVALRQQCEHFVADHADAIATARPAIPDALHDRAADIWEPLLALADLAGGHWPERARRAAVNLTTTAQDHNPIGSLLFDLFTIFALNDERLFTRDLIAALNARADRPWAEMLKGKKITDLWLSAKLRPYGIAPRTIRIGEQRAKGYLMQDFLDPFRRYIPTSEIEALRAQAQPANPPPTDGEDGNQNAR